MKFLICSAAAIFAAAGSASGETSMPRIEISPVVNSKILERTDGLPDGQDLYRLAFQMKAHWMQGPVELRIPEVLQSAAGFHFLDHFRTTITPMSEPDPFPEWVVEDDGSLSYLCKISEGVSFGARAQPGTDEVNITFYVQNDTGDSLRFVEANMCLDLGGSPDFNERGVLGPLYAVLDGQFKSLSETTPTPAEVGRDPWLVILPRDKTDEFQGPKDTGATWWRVNQLADANLMAATSADRRHLIGYTWDITSQTLMTNCGNPCLHTGPGRVESIADGERHTWHGKVYFLPNRPETLLERYETDHQTWRSQSANE